MKKIFAFIMAVIYITTTNGMVVNSHLCMGKKVTKNCLCNKAKETKSDCCKDEVKVVKLDNAHKAAVVAAGPQAPVALLPTPVSIIDLVKLPVMPTESPLAHGPPIVQSTPSYILHCVFRI